MESVRVQGQQSKSEHAGGNHHTRALAVSSRPLSLNDGRLSNTNSLGVSAALPEVKLPVPPEEQQVIGDATDSFCAAADPPEVPVRRVVQCKSSNSSSSDPL